MVDDLWWGYLHANGVVSIRRMGPHPHRDAHLSRRVPVVKVVGPFAEDIADVFEGDIKMVRRRIMAAIYNTPVEDQPNAHL